MNKQQMYTWKRPFGEFDPCDENEIIWCFPNKKDFYSRRDIAAALFRAKSPTLIRCIDQAVGRGWLETTTQRLPNGVDMFLYRLTEEGHAAQIPF